MTTIGKCPLQWPETAEEAQTWDPLITSRPVASARVMAVAHQRVEGKWCAYIDAVPGLSHSTEWPEVLHSGDKLDEKLALVLFPVFEGVPYAW